MRKPLRTDADYGRVSRLLTELDLNTVCRSARCPNRHECWNAGTATFLILGDVCTRRCRFCGVAGGTPRAPDPDEAARVAEASARMGLRHVVITSVTRDDLPDGGAAAFAASIAAVRERLPGAAVEVLTPDFRGDAAALETVLRARPDVFAHNLETVRRLQPRVRPAAGYERSLEVLRRAAAFAPPVAVKSGLMLGLGETHEERRQAIEDLHAAGCRLLTLGQYLSPDPRRCWPVHEFVTPAAFEGYGAAAREMGFEAVAAGPHVRSSYQADRLWRPAEEAVRALG